MKLKFNLFSIIVILCILVGSGIVLASDGQSEVNSGNPINDFYEDILSANGTFNMTRITKFKEMTMGSLLLMEI